MQKSKNIKNNRGEKGFAVLFSVMLASFLITLGISIFSISLKEIMITTSTRDSQVAYYAADSARECAIYWDIKQGAFPPCFDSNGNFIDCTETSNPSTKPTITCNGVDMDINFSHPQYVSTVYWTGANAIIDFFKYSVDNINSPRADVKIFKDYSTGNIRTTIEAYGHNTGIMGRRVERGIRQVNN